MAAEAFGPEACFVCLSAVAGVDFGDFLPGGCFDFALVEVVGAVVVAEGVVEGVGEGVVDGFVVEVGVAEVVVAAKGFDVGECVGGSSGSEEDAGDEVGFLVVVHTVVEGEDEAEGGVGVEGVEVTVDEEGVDEVDVWGVGYRCEVGGGAEAIEVGGVGVVGEAYEGFVAEGVVAVGVVVEVGVDEAFGVIDRFVGISPVEDMAQGVRDFGGEGVGGGDEGFDLFEVSDGFDVVFATAVIICSERQSATDDFAVHTLIEKGATEREEGVEGDGVVLPQGDCLLVARQEVAIGFDFGSLCSRTAGEECGGENRKKEGGKRKTRNIFHKMGWDMGVDMLVLKFYAKVSIMIKMAKIF